MKSKHLELSDEEKREFLDDRSRRFIHFTSKENAQKIIRSGFLIPTKGRLANHFTRSIDGKGRKHDSEMVYMFDSAHFSVDDYIRNLPRKNSPFNGCYEYYAVSTKPNEHEIEGFKRRAQDGAITYEGRLDIDGTDTRMVKYILGLDEHGEYKFEEVPFNFEYQPPQELLDKLARDKMGILRYNMTTHMSELRKARKSIKTYRAKREIHRQQIRRKKEFAKANKQFIEEEKDKSYIYSKDGRTLVVKNIEYEEIGGKKLQKIALIENNNKSKKSKDTVKFCYMDDYCSLDEMDSRVATEYFFNNLDNIQNSKEPEYIGMPLENLETGQIENEYDTVYCKNFKKYMDNRKKQRERLNPRYDKLKKEKRLGHKIKQAFLKFFNINNEVKLLEEKNDTTYEIEDREALAKLGYSSVEAINNDDKEAEMYAFLHSKTNDEYSVYDYYNSNGGQINKSDKEKTVGEI